MSRHARQRCPTCGRPNPYLAFVDETERERLYALAAAILCHCQRERAEKVVRQHVRRGQCRVHFAKEGDRVRKNFLSAISRTPIRALFVSATGKPSQARSECWTRLVPELVMAGVSELRIERQHGSEERDRRDIRGALESKGLLGLLAYDHVSPAAEPLLWVADAVVWSASARSEWRARVAPILL